MILPLLYAVKRLFLAFPYSISHFPDAFASCFRLLSDFIGILLWFDMFCCWVFVFCLSAYEQKFSRVAKKRTQLWATTIIKYKIVTSQMKAPRHIVWHAMWVERLLLDLLWNLLLDIFCSCKGQRLNEFQEIHKPNTSTFII